MNYANKWALITGASAGIGEVFARSFAAKGANVILVARREERLNRLAEELEGRKKIKTHCLAFDLSKSEAPDLIAQDLKSQGINVDILVNNAGFGLPGFFLESDWKTHRDFLELMVTSYCHLTHLFLPVMLERGFGRIIQVSSVAGLIPGSAGHTLYGPSKAFLVRFSEAIAAECMEKGVHVTALCPGFTYTEFHDVNDTRKLVSKLPKFMFMQPEPVVEGAINAVEKGKVVYVPGFWNKFIAAFIRQMPRAWSEALIRRNSSKFRRSPDTEAG